MKKSDVIRFVFFSLTLVAILWYPVNKILRFEFPDQAPAEYNFKLELYDPYDPLRGRYVALNNTMTVQNSHSNYVPLAFSQECCAVLQRDAEGFAVVTELVPAPPAGKDFIRVKYMYEIFSDDGKTECIIALPFDRFYLNEKDAPEMERRVREASAEGRAVVKVKVYKDGTAVISDLMVGE